MVQKGLKIKLRRSKRGIRSLETWSVDEIDENQNNSKKAKEDGPDNTITLMEDQFNHIIKTGVNLFSTRSALTVEKIKEKLSYLKVLRKLACSTDWKSRRIITNNTQIECFYKSNNGTLNYDGKELMVLIENFIEHKLKSFPGSSLSTKASSVAEHYKNELASYGITLDKLKEEINDLERALVALDGNIKIRRKSKYKFDYRVCRLCGSNQNLIYNINHKIDENLKLKDIVNRYCRVQLTEAPNLPELVCKCCKDHIYSFFKLSERIENFQHKLQQNFEGFGDASLENVSIQHIKTEIDKNSGNSLEENSNDSFSSAQDKLVCNDIKEVQINFNASSPVVTPDQFEVLDISDITEADDAHVEAEHTDLNVSDHDDNASSGFGSTEDFVTSSPTVTQRLTVNSVMPPCYILLNRLPILHLPSDDEDSSDNLLQEMRQKSKRGRSSKRDSLIIDPGLDFGRCRPFLEVARVKNETAMKTQDKETPL